MYKFKFIKFSFSACHLFVQCVKYPNQNVFVLIISFHSNFIQIVSFFVFPPLAYFLQGFTYGFFPKETEIHCYPSLSLVSHCYGLIGIHLISYGSVSITSKDCFCTSVENSLKLCNCLVVVVVVVVVLLLLLSYYSY